MAPDNKNMKISYKSLHCRRAEYNLKRKILEYVVKSEPQRAFSSPRVILVAFSWPSFSDFLVPVLASERRSELSGAPVLDIPPR